MFQTHLANEPFGIDVDSLVQDCGISIGKAMEIPQFCTKPSVWCDILFYCGSQYHGCL